ncbi:MAG: glycosyl hydrolase 53 family protein [Candidatus Methanofastidiosia archaeon]
MRKKLAGFSLIGILLISGCVNQKPQKSEIEDVGEKSQIPSIELNFFKKVEIPNGARPEVVATKDRVFVLYLNIENLKNRRFSLKIFDRDLNKEIASKTLVPTTSEYGSPTDIRVLSDGEYLYTFYETAKRDKTYLFGARYILNDNFERVGYTGLIATSKIFTIAEEGDEKLDDPAPVIGLGSVFVVTRIKKSMEKTGQTIYRVREFSFDLKTKLSEFDLDLSSIVDGGARQTSLIYEKSFFYIAVPTTVGVSTIPELDLAYPSDIVLVKLNDNWQIVESKIISANPEYNETYVTGFKTDGIYYYLTYNEIKMGVEFRSPLKIYDNDFNLLKTEIVKSMSMRGKGGYGLRPSLEVTDDRIFLGNNEERNAEIYIFEKITSLLDCPKLMPPSPQLQEQCQKEGGQLEPQKNSQGCVVGYKCEKIEEPTSTTDYEDSPFGFLNSYIDNSITKPVYAAYGGFSVIQAFYRDLNVHWDRGSGEKGGAVWGVIEPNPPVNGFHTYEWSSLDDYVNTANKNNINLLVTINPGCLWGGSRYGLPTDIFSYVAFVKVLVQRYPNVKYWQIHNEVNGGVFWKDNPKNYAKLVRATSNAIKKGCPECKIVLGSSINIDERANPKSIVPYFESVLQELKKDDKKYFDVFDYHFFPPNGYTPDSYYKMLDEGIDSVRNLLDRYGYNNAEIWITETMILTTDGMNNNEIQRLPEEYRVITEKQQALALFKTYVLALSKGVEKIFWNKLTEGSWFDFMFNRCGLIRHSDFSGSTDKKLSYYTYKLMTEKLEGSDWNNIKIVKEEQNDTYGIHLYKFTNRTTGSPIWVGWWDCFDEQKCSKMKIDIQVEIDLGRDIYQAKITEAVPKYESGRDVTDYDTAFESETRSVIDGKITITLKEIPLFVEAKFQKQIIEWSGYGGVKDKFYVLWWNYFNERNPLKVV